MHCNLLRQLLCKYKPVLQHVWHLIFVCVQRHMTLEKKYNCLLLLACYAACKSLKSATVGFKFPVRNRTKMPNLVLPWLITVCAGVQPDAMHPASPGRLAEWVNSEPWFATADRCFLFLQNEPFVYLVIRRNPWSHGHSTMFLAKQDSRKVTSSDGVRNVV